MPYYSAALFPSCNRVAFAPAKTAATKIITSSSGKEQSPIHYNVNEFQICTYCSTDK